MASLSSTAPEFAAVILAATTGARFFPLTSSSTSPKHLLPIAGVPVLLRLLQSVAASGFLQCTVALAHDDTVTLDFLKEELAPHMSQNVFNYKNMLVTLHVLSNDCAGSAEALRHVDGTIPPGSHTVVLPGDLVVLETSTLRKLVDAHRQANLLTHDDTACTMLLADVGEQDEHGLPLKESSKAKKGGLARDEEAMEYIALQQQQHSSCSQLAPRVIWKQSKIDVEEDEDWVGQTPKLIVPKARLRGCCGGMVTQVSTDWADLHVYVLSPWLRVCVRERNLLSIQGDGIPLWVTRQFQGIRKTFGSHVRDAVVDRVLSPLVAGQQTLSTSEEEYFVRAYVLDGWKALRACTIPAYLYACREVVNRAIDDNHNETKNPCVALPLNTTVNDKFHSIVLDGATLGDKVTCKSSTVGRRCLINAKCRLNNVVVMDDVTVRNNCILQNSILGSGCTIGENCNLNDCQVAPGKDVPAGTKEKGESLMDAL